LHSPLAAIDVQAHAGNRTRDFFTCCLTMFAGRTVEPESHPAQDFLDVIDGDLNSRIAGGAVSVRAYDNIEFTVRIYQEISLSAPISACSSKLSKVRTVISLG
jgi:hypothetical protein